MVRKLQGATAERDDRVAMYVKVSKKNYAFICKQVAANNQWVAAVVDAALDACRLKRDFKLEKREALTVKKLAEKQEKRLRKYATHRK